MEYCEINLALASSFPSFVHGSAHCTLPRTANIPSATRLPANSVTGPWFCAPAFRLVCLFEDDDAAGPLIREKPSSPCAPKCELERFGRRELIAARALASTCQGADAHHVMPPPNTMSIPIEVKPAT